MQLTLFDILFAPIPPSAEEIRAAGYSKADITMGWLRLSRLLRQSIEEDGWRDPSLRQQCEAQLRLGERNFRDVIDEL